ncbi:hypothetical protein HPY42_02840 [Coprothermobacteraceae bacterium]|nr:hypothetical protein [Coprothermobacteraceae bacterium]
MRRRMIVQSEALQEYETNSAFRKHVLKRFYEDVDRVADLWKMHLRKRGLKPKEVDEIVSPANPMFEIDAYHFWINNYITNLYQEYLDAQEQGKTNSQRGIFG